MKYYTLVGACILCFVSAAHAQQIRDMSLSPAQTAQQPSVTHSQDYLNPNANPYQGADGAYRNVPADQNKNGDPYANGDYDEVDAGNAQHSNFMDIFCDPNVKPMATSESMSSCIEAARQDACGSFNHLPQDVQHALDHEIGCIHGAMDADGNLTAPNCGDDDHRRLVLLKKYWRDQDTAYALVFLPDKVLNGSAQCVHSSGGY